MEAGKAAEKEYEANLEKWREGRRNLNARIERVLRKGGLLPEKGKAA
jgi:hypothetical protein